MFYVVLVGVFAFLAAWNADPFLLWMEETMEWAGWIRSTIIIFSLGLVPAIIIVAGGVLGLFVSDSRRKG